VASAATLTPRRLLSAFSVAQLRQELPGKTLTQVATAHGKNPADVAGPLKNAEHQASTWR